MSHDISCCFYRKHEKINLHHLIARFQNLGEMMTLGRNDAALSPSFIEGLTLEGPIGHTGNFLFQYLLMSLLSLLFGLDNLWSWFFRDCSKENSILD